MLSRGSAVLFTSLLLTTPAFANTESKPIENQWRGSTTVEVTVLDATGAVVEGAEVLVETRGGGRSLASATQPGLYRLQLAAGSYLVTVFKPGFQPATQELAVTSSGALRDRRVSKRLAAPSKAIPPGSGTPEIRSEYRL